MNFRIIRRVVNLDDVDPANIADGRVLVARPDAGQPSGFIHEYETMGGAGGAFSLGVSDLGNTLGQTGVTGSRIVLAGIGALTLSQLTDVNGGTISISSPVQTIQTQNVHNVTLDGNTAGALAEVSSGTLTLAGGNSITLSQNGNAITISGATTSQSVQTQSRFNLTLDGNTAGALALVSSGVLTLAGGNSITLSQNGNAITISGATTSQSVQTQNMVAVTLSGNTSGAQALISSGTLTLAGGNNITVSQNGNAVTISGPNVGGAQTGISGIVASDATYTSGTVTFTGSGDITVLSGTGQRVIISGSQSVQPGVQHLVVSNTTFSSGTVSISGFGDVTVNTAANIIRISAPVQTAQTGISGIANSQTTYTSGTVSLSELGAITIRSTTGNQFQFSVNAQTTQTQGILSAGVSTGGNTAGNTQVSTGSRLVLAGAGEITLSQATAAGASTISISAPAQTVQTQGILSAGVSTGGNTAGNTQVSTGSRLVLVGSGMITASQGTAAGASTITLNATQSVQPGIQHLVVSNTTFSSGTVSLSGFGDITVNTAANIIRISGPVQTVESQSIGMSNIGNTSGTTGIASGGQVRFLFAGGNNITLSQSLDGASGTITISAPNLGAGAMSAGASNLGNTAGATGITGTQLVMVGSGVVSLSQTTGANGGTLSILAPATSSLVGTNGVSVSTNGSTISVMQTTFSGFDPYQEAAFVVGSQGQGTLHLNPLTIPNVQFDRVGIPLLISNPSNSSGSITISQYFGIYTRNASSLSLVSSTSISTNFSGSGTAGSYSLYGGFRLFTIPLTMTLTGGQYWFGQIHRSTSAANSGHSVWQVMGSLFSNTGISGLMGVASTKSIQYALGFGVMSVSSAAMPNSVAFTAIDGTGTVAVRPPLFRLVSGTV